MFYRVRFLFHLSQNWPLWNVQTLKTCKSEMSHVMFLWEHTYVLCYLGDWVENVNVQMTRMSLTFIAVFCGLIFGLCVICKLAISIFPFATCCWWCSICGWQHNHPYLYTQRTKRSVGWNMVVTNLSGNSFYIIEFSDKRPLKTKGWARIITHTHTNVSDRRCKKQIQ